MFLDRDISDLLVRLDDLDRDLSDLSVRRGMFRSNAEDTRKQNADTLTAGYTKTK